MIRLFHSRLAEGRILSAEDTDILAEARAAGGWAWLDVVEPTPGEIALLVEAFGLLEADISDVLEFTEYPNLQVRDDYLFVIVHSPSMDREKLRTVEVDAFLGRDYLITIRSEDLPGFELAEEAIPDTARADAHLAYLLDIFVHRFRLIVDNLDGEVDRLEVMAIAGDPTVLEQIRAMRRDVIRLRRVLIPQRDVLRAMTRMETDVLSGEAAKHTIEGSFDDCLRALEEIDSARVLLGSALETYRATVAERMNEVMKLLTVFSAIILPLGLIAGIYGMNFAEMPELRWPHGYFIVLGSMVTLGLALWVYFARRGFIGGPKVPRLDRAAGRGLAAFVHLSLHPARRVWKAVSGNSGARSKDESAG